MKPFVFKHAEDLWPEGATLLHVYALVDLARNHRLAALIDGGRQATDRAAEHIGDTELRSSAAPEGGRHGGSAWFGARLRRVAILGRP